MPQSDFFLQLPSFLVCSFTSVISLPQPPFTLPFFFNLRRISPILFYIIRPMNIKEIDYITISKNMNSFDDEIHLGVMKEVTRGSASKRDLTYLRLHSKNRYDKIMLTHRDSRITFKLQLPKQEIYLKAVCIMRIVSYQHYLGSGTTVLCKRNIKHGGKGKHVGKPEL